MTQPNDNGGASSTPAFSKRDMETVLAIMDNQPLQNMKVAREMQALQTRFTLFCSRHLPKPEAEKPAAGGKRGAKSATEVDPAS